MPNIASGRMRILRQRGVAIAVLLILIVYGFEAHARRRALSTPPSMGDQGAYLGYARFMYDSNYTVVGERNRMPVYPFLLSLIYEPGLSEIDFLRRAQAFNVNLSILLLGLLYLLFRKFFPPWPAVALLAATAFGVFIYRAINAQTEVLFYFISFCAFVLLLRTLIAPRWWLATLGGATMGVAHLSKASVLPALVVWIAVFAAQLVWNLRKARGSQTTEFWHGLGMLLLVIATFLAVIFPYIQTSKRIYGQYFYNVNSTFVMWFDSPSEGWNFVTQHAQHDQWRSLPREQLPSFSKYWREHSLAQIIRRQVNGSWNLITQNAMVIGYYKFMVAFVIAGALYCARQRGRVRELLSEYPFAAAFCALFFCAYFVLYAWYQALSSDTRFILSIFLPCAFAASLFLMRVGRGRVVALAGHRLPFEQFFPGILIALALVDAVYNAKFLL
jgi:4-amino-4-deoxy-L-arabinose transferase-like glycosyltransferase